MVMRLCCSLPKQDNRPSVPQNSYTDLQTTNALKYYAQVLYFVRLEITVNVDFSIFGECYYWFLRVYIKFSLFTPTKVAGVERLAASA